MIGKLRHKIDIYTPTIPTGFGFNNSAITRTNNFTCWAAIKEISRKQKIDSGLDGVVVTYEVIIRGVVDSVKVNVDDTVSFRGVNYSVLTTPTLINLSNKMYYKFLMVQRDE